MSLSKIKKTKENVDILNGPIIPAIVRYALPIILTSVLQILYNTADIAAVGNLASSVDLAAVGATTIIVNIFVVAVVNVAAGSNIIAARAFGANDPERIRRVVKNAYTFSVCLGVFMAILGYALTMPLLRLTECPDNIIEKSALYMRIYFIGLPASALYNYLAGILSSSGESKKPFVYLVISGASNVVLNVVLILVTGEAVASVAIATVASMYVSLAMILVHFVRRKDAARLSLHKFGMDAKVILKIVRLGVPAAVSSLCYNFANMFVQAEVNAYGDFAISGNTAAVTMESIVFAVTGAASGTAAVFIGQNLGAGNKSRVFEIMKKNCFFWSGVASVALVLCFVLGRPILGLLIPGETEAINFGMVRVYMICGSAIIHVLYNINNGAMNAFGYALYQMIINVFFICGFRIPWMVFVYPMAPTPTMMYVIYPISFVLVLMVNSFCVVRLFSRLKRGDDFLL